ncbi:MAG: type IV pilin biogenesis protein, partial [Nannocystaceae bacterium]
GAGDTNDTNPCDEDPSNAHNFDTCRDPSDPQNDCAFLADSPEELALVLTQIVEGELAMDVPAGTGAAVNTFGTTGGGSEGITQTDVAARTEWPAWRGHVERSLCDDVIEDPANPGAFITAPYCLAANFDEVEEAFGPCPQSREWDAGECLEMTDWADRRIYITDANNNVHPIYDGTQATSAFVDQLNAPDLGIPGGPFDPALATQVAEFIMGKDWKDGWKLPGLAASSPMVVRRVPKPNKQYAPSVGISDPHCAGRLLASPEEVDEELVAFAEDAWDPTLKLTAGFSSHYEYQEAVLIGDDLGLLHAFQFDSGNEMWALLPRFSLAAAVSEFAYGGEEMGQPDKLEDHIYGVSGTVNHGWVHDPVANKWRHLAVVGMGEGGNHLLALDVSHMSPVSADDPVEVLWTSDDVGLKSFYEPTLGETWARPALTYHIEELGEEPESLLVFGSGYPDDVPTSPYQGRRLVVADALTGEPREHVDLPPPTSPVYEPLFAAVVDPAVGTHCISRFWGEAQETYIADPAGRLFRWDLKEGFAHEADSGTGPWSANGDVAEPVATFSACEGTTAPCTISGGNLADPFLFSPAIVSINRIDEMPGNSGQGIGDDDQDQFLIAMVSGSPYDDTLDANDTSIDFHPSLYILVDDHRGTNNHGGFSIPSTTDRVPVGDSATFVREVLTDIERVRSFVPYPGFVHSGTTPCPGGAAWDPSVERCIDTRNFSKRARPIRAPRISVTGLNRLTGCADLDDPSSCTGSVLESGVEVYTIEFTVFESGTNACEPGWYDPSEEIWHFDQGASYTLSYTLAVQDAAGFDLLNGAGLGYLEGGGALKYVGVTQNLSDGCADGNCGPVPGVPSNPPCDPNDLAPPPDVTYTIPLTTSELEGFTRVQTSV